MVGDIFSKALEEEIEYLKKKPMTQYELSQGTADSGLSLSGKRLCHFPNPFSLSLKEGSFCKLIIGKDEHLANVYSCSCKEIVVNTVDLQENFVPKATLVLLDWLFLYYIKKKYDNLTENEFVSLIRQIHNAVQQESLDSSLVPMENSQALERIEASRFTVVFGAPGTGKTYILANLAIQSLQKGKSVLVVSPSNQNVEEAVSMIEECAKVHDAQNIAKDDFDKQTPLMDDGEDLLSLVKCGESIKATTPADLMMYDDIKNEAWDVILYDNIGMAYIPQIYNIASMAKEKFVVFGDCRLLGPIAHKDQNSPLHKSFFSYVNVVDEDDVIHNHAWLVMLSNQWRINPAIWEFPNHQFYNGLVYPSEIVGEATSGICSMNPFPGKAMAFVDYSHFSFMCMRGPSGSRFNLLSAVISLSLAYKALEHNDHVSVGIVTHYNAQADLISSMVKEQEQEKEIDVSKLIVATVSQAISMKMDIVIFDTTVGYPQKSKGIFDEHADGERYSTEHMVDTAITLARGKFLMVGDLEYLEQKDKFSSPILQELIDATKGSLLQGESFVRSLLMVPKYNGFQCFPQSELGLIPFFKDLRTCTQYVEYYHNGWNSFADIPYAHGFFDCVKALAEVSGCQFSAYEGMISKMGLKEVGLSSSTFLLKEPLFDDFFILDRTSIWINIPVVKGNDITVGKERICMQMTGKTMVHYFLDWFGIIPEITRLEKPFDRFIASRHMYVGEDGRTILGQGRIGIGDNKSYRIISSNRGYVIVPYIPFDDLRAFLSKQNIRCKTCNSPIVMNSDWSFSCSKCKEHHVDFTLEDIVNGKVK